MPYLGRNTRRFDVVSSRRYRPPGEDEASVATSEIAELRGLAMLAIKRVPRNSLTDVNPNMVGGNVGVGFAEGLDQATGKDAMAEEAAIEDTLIFCPGGKNLTHLAIPAGEFREHRVVDGFGAFDSCHIAKRQAAVAGVNDQEDVFGGNHRKVVIADGRQGEVGVRPFGIAVVRHEEPPVIADGRGDRDAVAGKEDDETIVLADLLKVPLKEPDDALPCGVVIIQCPDLVEAELIAEQLSHRLGIRPRVAEVVLRIGIPADTDDQGLSLIHI